MQGQLTERQQQVLDAIIGYFTENGRMPTYRQVAHLMGFKTRGAMTYYLLALEKKGFVERGKDGSYKNFRLKGYRVELVKEGY